MDPAVSLQRVLLRQPNGKAGDAPGCRRSAGLAPVARIVLLRTQFAVPGQQCRWGHGEDFRPAPAREEPRQRGEPYPVSRVVPDPADVAPEHRVLVSKHQQLSSLCPVAAKHQQSRTEDPPRQQVDDLEQHPPSQPSRRPARWRSGWPRPRPSIRAAQDRRGARRRVGRRLGRRRPDRWPLTGPAPAGRSVMITAACRLGDALDKGVSPLSDIHGDRRPELYRRVTG